MLSTLRSLLGLSGSGDWQRSSAHLLLLSKFLLPRTFGEYAEKDYWKDVLKEPVARALKQFLADGVLISSGLAGRMEYRFKVTDLRSMLRQRGLPVSGRKADLIARLIEADPEGMKTAVAGLTVLQCSDRGQVIVRQYLAAEEARRAAARQATLARLQQGKFKQAGLLMASYEAGQVFQRGINVDWQNYDPSGDALMLKSIFTGGTPKVLAQLGQSKLGPLRVAAAMMNLWSLTGAEVVAWLPSGFETGLTMDAPTAVRMLLTYLGQQSQLQDYREMAKSGLCKSVSMNTCNDESVCPACRALARRHFKLSEVPDLPYEKCASETGCRCWMVADVL